ncbi:uncharacterized protein LOC131205988 [Anopheles bellator]|uniref:uncharacterized protein LOC131205988 n=1 Tax=Anopheles bellator TaxID=139047 RepID=UPI00264814B3|nr:uncharacterized protein LOC131205988 [Anopheles bellator]
MTLPEALLKRLAKRGLIAGGGKAGTENQQQTAADDDNGEPPLGTEQDSDGQHSEERSDNDDGDSDSDSEDRRDLETNNEEVIAEDYDEYDQPNPDAFEYASKKKANSTTSQGADWSEKIKQKMTKRYGYQSVDGCQNKYNIYHLCTMYCVKRYGEVEFEIDKDYDKRVKRLLERFPLPKNWRKEYDIGCKAFYFYNKDTRIVSWLPPTHPDAKLSKSAKVLRRERIEEEKQKEAARAAVPPTVVVETYPPTPAAIGASKPLIGPTVAGNAVAPPSSAVPTGSLGPLAENLKPPVVNPPKRPAKRDDEKPKGEQAAERESDRDREYRDHRTRDRRDRDRRDRDRSPMRGEDRGRGGNERQRDRDHRGDHHRGGRGGRLPKGQAPLDPMDPAAYSDIPRGNWSAGLDTASGAAKKEKEDRKKQPAPPPTADDDEGAHEVLKVSAVNEFQQEHDDDDEGEDDGDLDD